MGDPNQRSEKSLGLRDSTEAERQIEKVVGQIRGLRHTNNRESARYLEGYIEGVLWCYSRARGQLGHDLELALKEVGAEKPEVEGAPAPSGALGAAPAPVKTNAPTTSQE